MKWLITGGNGMVGSEMHLRLRERGEDSTALGKSDLDITSRESVISRIEQLGPEIIVNCAAFTKVDDCEAQERHATLVNGTAVAHLAAAAGRALLVHLSTDFVFDGATGEPYREDAPVAPLSAYGRSKLAGEIAAANASEHLIVRTSWVFGPRGWNFVEAIRKQLDAGREELRVVNDQRGRPTYTTHLANAILALVEARARGIVHYADAPECTWHDFAIEIARTLQRNVRVTPISSDEIERPARRPSYSVLSTERYERLTGRKPAPWAEGLRVYLGR